MLTVLILARNASSTIARAIRSARAERPSQIIVIDHASRDGTSEEAGRLRGDDLVVITAGEEATRGAARQMGLDRVTTLFGMWLDGGDELLPGRGARLIGQLEAHEADFAFDEIDLHDGATGAFIRRLEMPALIGGRRQMVRLFERNYLPGVGVPLFRTAAAREIGFDVSLPGAEDYDFVLRAVVAGRGIVLARQAGYRQFETDSTSSRDDADSPITKAVLRKHAPRTVEHLFRSAGYHERTIAWGMISFLTMRGDYGLALAWLDKLPQGSRREFQRGTLLAALGRHAEALDPLQQAYDEAGVPELLNNFGVVLAALGRTAEANSLFADALRELPEYSDASANLLAERPTRLTLLPLRREHVRSGYSPG